MKDTLEVLATLVPVHSLDNDTQSVLNSISVSDATKLVRYLYREFKNDPHASLTIARFAAGVQRSSITSQQWASQMLQVYEWLEKRGSTARFDDVVEYVSCALEGSSLQVGHSMEWYLEQYGFEKSRPSTTSEKKSA